MTAEEVVRESVRGARRRPSTTRRLAARAARRSPSAESLAGVAIPGLTSVDPALLAADGLPIRIPGPSASQGVANGVVVAAMVGGPVGFIALGGIAAVAAAEYAGAKRELGTPEDLANVGRPSELALRALERAEAEGPGAVGEARPDMTQTTATPAEPAPDSWRDLPTPAADAEPAAQPEPPSEG